MSNINLSNLVKKERQEKIAKKTSLQIRRPTGNEQSRGEKIESHKRSQYQGERKHI